MHTPTVMLSGHKYIIHTILSFIAFLGHPNNAENFPMHTHHKVNVSPKSDCQVVCT